MKFKAIQKFVRMSPRKLSLVAAVVRNLSPKEAAEILPQVGKRAGLVLSKVVKTAIANAKNKGVVESDLVLAEIQIHEGPSYKRGRPVSRGRWHSYKRRMSHIRVVLTTKPKALNMNTKPQTGKSRGITARKDKNATKIIGSPKNVRIKKAKEENNKKRKEENLKL